MSIDKEVPLMVKREKVVDPRGRSWVSGKLGSEEYFSAAASSALEQARRTVAARLDQHRTRRIAS